MYARSIGNREFPFGYMVCTTFNKQQYKKRRNQVKGVNNQLSQISPSFSLVFPRDCSKEHVQSSTVTQYSDPPDEPLGPLPAVILAGFVRASLPMDVEHPPCSGTHEFSYFTEVTWPRSLVQYVGFSWALCLSENSYFRSDRSSLDWMELSSVAIGE